MSGGNSAKKNTHQRDSIFNANTTRRRGYRILELIVDTQGRARYNETRRDRALITQLSGWSRTTGARQDRFERCGRVAYRTLPYHYTHNPIGLAFYIEIIPL